MAEMEVKLLNLKGEESGTAVVSDKLFNESGSPVLVTRAVRRQLWNARRFIAKRKTRGEVKGSGRKIWRQKGLGRARHKDRQAPIFVGGGLAFPPRGNKRYLKMNKKERKKVIRLLLTHYYKNGDIVFLNGGDLDGISTKKGVEVLKNVGLVPGEQKVLWVYDRNLETREESPYNLNLSLRNVEKVKLLPWDRLNALDLVYTDKVVINKGALEKINQTWGR